MTDHTQSGIEAIQGTLGNRETGQLGSIVPNGKVFIPGGPVTLGQDGTLRWEIHWRKAEHKTPTRAMFDNFIRLWDEPDEKIREFAETWGPLDMDGAGNQVPLSALDRTDPWNTRGFDYLSSWRYFSRRAYSILKIATELTQNRKRAGGSVCRWTGDDADLDVIASPQEPGPASISVCAFSPFRMPNHSRLEHSVTSDGVVYGKPLDQEGVSKMIASELHDWLKKFGVSLSAKWTQRFKWQLEISYRGWLMSAIALQLGLAVMRADGFYICSGCERLYARTGKLPNAGERNYCPKCGSKSGEDAVRRYRQRQADARRMAKEGKSASEIQRILGVEEISSVRRWIAKGKRDAQAKARKL